VRLGHARSGGDMSASTVVVIELLAAPAGESA
jgi:hypothetical protein